MSLTELLPLLLRMQQVPNALSTPRHYMNDTSPYVGESLGIPIRPPYESENDFFRRNPEVAGYASPDGAVVLNPESKINATGKRSVATNEAVRQWLNRVPDTIKPSFNLTEEQNAMLGGYSPNPQDIRNTLTARILSGDPSAGDITPEQYAQAMAVMQWILKHAGR